MNNYYYQIIEEPTIIEILDEIAKGTLGEGSTFKYDDDKWIYDGEDIRTQEQDYYDADVKTYKYLSEVIDLSNLNDKVEDFNRVYTITMTTTNCSNIGESKIQPSTVTKAKPSSWHYSSFSQPKSVHRCPVCGGNGIVSNGFYNHTGNTWVTSTTAPEQCRSCHGKGYVVVDD